MVDRVPVTGEILRGSLLEPASHHADVHALKAAELSDTDDAGVPADYDVIETKIAFEITGREQREPKIAVIGLWRRHSAHHRRPLPMATLQVNRSSLIRLPLIEPLAWCKPGSETDLHWPIPAR